MLEEREKTNREDLSVDDDVWVKLLFLWMESGGDEETNKKKMSTKCEEMTVLLRQSCVLLRYLLKLAC